MTDDVATTSPTLLSRIIAGVRYIGLRVFDMAVAAAVGAIVALFFTRSADTYLFPSKYGEHCPKQFFSDRIEDGMKIAFAPDRTINMAVCGLGTVRTGSTAEAKFRHYAEVTQKNCFKVSRTGAGITISPKLEKDDGRVTVRKIGSADAYFCNCDPVQIDLLLQKKKFLCGLSVQQ